MGNAQDRNEGKGAFWWKPMKARYESYLSGNIQINGEIFYIALFPNQDKRVDKQPDYIAKLSTKQQDNE